ncbi:sulfatase family protein [Agriterribacter humi]|jgi:arylsulfatase A-like enzyme|uniref:sulfatase family protein n=1 Tax=Agriterribacter humi TaxID=1104781 RepID=UPI0012657571|nr:arylsulfatase [Agriterribacter humi]
MKSINNLTTLAICCLAAVMTQAQQKPNIIYILADDLGYGDVSCLNADSKLHTVNIDKMAAGGMKFTDAHSNSAVCTPTRYGIITGRYAWRTVLQNGVLWGYDTMLIKNSRTTLASLLKRNGYHTGGIGKWHLGLDWKKNESGAFDFFQPLAAGPLQAGFDYFYGIPASLDMQPYFYIENNRVTATAIDSTGGNSGKGFWRAGPAGNDFRHEEVFDRITDKAVDYISREAKSDNPFFLYFALTSPHTPILPTHSYQGKSGTNAYGDFVLMTDDVVGKILDAVKTAGIEQNTIIVFTSDNGCSPSAGFEELSAAGHHPSYIYRGAKADIFEGGHRIPFIVKWPKMVKAGTETAQTICLTDFMATLADMFQQPLKDNEGEDSFSLLPLLLQKNGYARTSIIHHSIDGNFSIRKNDWKLIFARGSGGWSAPTEKEAKTQGLPDLQLYNLKTDIRETNNVASDHPSVVRELSAIAKAIIENGRSTKGKKQKNDTEVNYREWIP